MRLLWFSYRVVVEISGSTSVSNSKLSTPPGIYTQKQDKRHVNYQQDVMNQYNRSGLGQAMGRKQEEED